MRRIPVLLPVIAAVLLSACGTRVNRIDPGTRTDLSGKWNDTDVRTACGNLIASCLNSGGVNAYIRNFQLSRNGRLPVVIVGEFANASSEHIDTGIIAEQMEIAIVNSGSFEFVAGGDLRSSLRSERQDQMNWASDDTALSLANETGANLMLTGSVRSIVDRAGRVQVRTYYVTARLTNIETGSQLWMDSDSSIKKEIRQAAYRP